uniref:Uncharacterized protein n=1 Tax=Globodera rostochiensis TaxID=31243 RepID=A0A914HJ81_GLORO
MNAQKIMIVALVIAVAMLSMEVPLVDAHGCIDEEGLACVSNGCPGTCMRDGSQCSCMGPRLPIDGNPVKAAANDGTAGSK